MSNPYGNDPYGQQPPNPYGQQPPNPYGQSGGSSFNAPGVGGFEQKKTDGVSVAALVLGILCCSLGGLILGFIGLGRTKGGQRKGRGMAIAGIVLGFIGLIVNVVVIIGLVAGVGFLSSIVTPENAEVGQCIDVDEDGGEVLLREAECNEEHDAEIVGVAEVTNENLDLISTGMVGYCETLIDEADRAKLDAVEGLEYSAVIEDPNDVSVGDTLVCYVESDDKLDEPIL